MKNITEIDKSLEEAGLLIKCVSETKSKDEVKQKKGEFIHMFLGTLGTSL